jgi:hypothetical protein
MKKQFKQLAASLVLGSFLLVLLPAMALAAPTCQPVRDNGDLERAARGILGLEGEVGLQEVKEALRYPRFNLSVAGRNRGMTSLDISARSFRAPAGLYGAPLVQTRKYAQMAIEAGCEAVVRLMPVQRVRRCAPTYSPEKGVYHVCRTRWWPRPGKNCERNPDGSFLCEWIERRFRLGEPVRVRVPQGKNQGVRLFVEIPDYIIPNECICELDGVPTQGSGRTNELLLR